MKMPIHLRFSLITDCSVACKVLIFFAMLKCSKVHDGKDSHHIIGIFGIFDLEPEGIVDRGS